MKKSDAAHQEEFMRTVKDRFKRCEEWEGECRKRYVEDRKFANADSDNGWQWDDDIRSLRNVDNRPCLTINKTRQHNLQIINDGKKNKPEVRIRPVGGGATYKSAQVYQSVIRHIEYISNSEDAYSHALTTTVEGGWGYWRVVTDYADNETLDQEIFIRRIKDPLSVYMDPDIREVDGSDARFCFIFDDLSRDEFDQAYPQYKDELPPPVAIGNNDDWLKPDHVRICEYYRMSEQADTLISYIDPTGERKNVKVSKIGKEVAAALLADPTADARTRDISNSVVEWSLIIGDKEVEKSTWPGVYIPVVRVIGEETVIDGKLDRKGHTRYQKDPQRQYNYWSSSAAEFVALQGKSPFVGPARAIEGLENYWETANTESHSVLPYNDVADDGTPIARPERAQPPVMAPAYISGMEVARQELMEASGQYQAEMGAPGNERSGVAIEARQRQGDTATYHFIDNLAIAIRFTGKILIDLIPKIYDTPRIINIMADDDQMKPDMPAVNIDPQAPTAYQEQQDDEGNVVKMIFNPNVGKYDVMADIGPDFATKRQEAFNALMQVVEQDSNLINVIGDIMFRAADFPMADEVSDRLRNMVPPQALGGPSPEMQAMQQQIGQLSSALQNALQSLADEKKKVGVEAYKAETDRLKVGSDIDPLALVPVIRQAVMDALGGRLPEGLPAIGSQIMQATPETQQEAA